MINALTVTAAIAIAGALRATAGSRFAAGAIGGAVAANQERRK